MKVAPGNRLRVPLFVKIPSLKILVIKLEPPFTVKVPAFTKVPTDVMVMTPPLMFMTALFCRAASKIVKELPTKIVKLESTTKSISKETDAPPVIVTSSRLVGSVSRLQLFGSDQLIPSPPPSQDTLAANASGIIPGMAKVKLPKNKIANIAKALNLRLKSLFNYNLPLIQKNRLFQYLLVPYYPKCPISYLVRLLKGDQML